MVNNIVNKVKSLERNLDKEVRDELKTSSDEIRVISTFDTDHQIVEVTKKHASNLSLKKVSQALILHKQDLHPNRTTVYSSMSNVRDLRLKK